MLEAAVLQDTGKLLRAPDSTLKHIPKVFRSACAGELHRLLSAANLSGAFHDYLRLLVFAKAMLAPLRRGGKRGKAQACLVLGRRLADWHTRPLTHLIAVLVDTSSVNVFLRHRL